MTRSQISRRMVLKGAISCAGVVTASGELLAQPAVSRSAASPGAPLPPRNEFLIRGASVLTMDPNIGDFGTGDVHVRDGTIIAVGPRVDLPNPDYRGPRHDLHAGLHRHALAPLDESLAAVRQGRRRGRRLLS